MQLRAVDGAGHTATSTQTVKVDNLPPQVSIPKQWMVWEAARLVVEDQGIGLGRVRVTIEGGSYGQRTYSYEGAGAVPSSIKWDRYFGDISARIREYPVMVEAWDRVGNRSVAWGMVVVPAPDATPTVEAAGCGSLGEASGKTTSKPRRYPQNCEG